MPMPPPFAPFTASTRLLAMDCAGDTLSLALTEGDAVREARESPGGAQSSDTLLPTAQAMLDALGWTWRDLQGVAFGQGPGAFTGLRTACAVAQGLAFGLGCPVLPLDSLALVAEDAPWRDDAHPVWVAMDARMDEVYAAAYRAHPGGGWAVQVAPALLTLEALAACWRADPPRRIAGSAIAAFAGRLPFGDAALHPAETDRAAALLRLARRAWADGAAVDPAQALPVYLRDKVALTTAERAKRTAAQAAA